MASHVESIDFLQVQDITDTFQKFQSVLLSLRDIKMSIEMQTTALYAVWNGKGRNAFENQYRQLFSKISDINDALDEMYEALVNSAALYEQVDSEIAQKLDMSAGQTVHRDKSNTNEKTGGVNP